MNNFESFLVELLQGQIYYDDKIVEVRRTFLPSAELPCITLNVVGDDTLYTYKTFNTREEQYARRQSEIQVSTWCNTEEARESINQQVMTAFHLADNHHYKYCSNYTDGNCTSTGSTCGATINTSTNSRSARHQCPDPEGYNYESLFKKHGLLHNTWMLEPPFYSDELQEHPPILHSILKAKTYYDEKISSIGVPVQGFGGMDVEPI